MEHPTTIEIHIDEYKQFIEESAIFRLMMDYLASDTGYTTADDLRKILGIPNPVKKKAETAATETANDEILPRRNLNMPIL